VLAEDLVVEALHAERELVALVLGGLDGVGGIGRVDDDVLRRWSFGRRSLRTGGRLARVDVPATPIDEDGNAGGADQQDEQNCCRNGDGEGSRAWSVRAA
jgi:hypothetical protein